MKGLHVGREGVRKATAEGLSAFIMIQLLVVRLYPIKVSTPEIHGAWGVVLAMNENQYP